MRAHPSSSLKAPIATASALGLMACAVALDEQGQGLVKTVAREVSDGTDGGAPVLTVDFMS